MNIKEIAVIVLALLVIVLFLNSCAGNNIPLRVGDEIQIPEGYTFLDAAAYGEFASYTTIYCENNTTHRIYKCTKGRVGEEIIFPEGYTFAGVSQFGRFSSFTTFYCRPKDSNRVFVCKPQ